jgi:hypothetical protein
LSDVRDRIVDVRWSNPDRAQKVVPVGTKPLAPTKLINLAHKVDHRRKRCVESEVDGVLRKRVLELLESEDVAPGKDRDDQRLRPSAPDSSHRRDSERA